MTGLKLILICSDPHTAAYAEACGVNRVLVDLEINGKLERQGHLNTVISRHSMSDVAKVRALLNRAELLVRLNPLHGGTRSEIDEAIDLGADLLMLPMFESSAELRLFIDLVRSRAKVIPLVETPSALWDFGEIVRIAGVNEIYIGLNDLHLALGRTFMFELLADGTVENLAAECRQVGVPFGFGGIARMNEGLLPGRSVLAEHLRLGSSSVILSRTFHREGASLRDMQVNLDFKESLSLLRHYEVLLAQRSSAEIEEDRLRLLKCVETICAQIRSGAGQ